MKFKNPQSPLRYPGGKRKLAKAIHQLISLDGREVETLVEPFAGGASVAISFLENTEAGVILSDLDPLVSAFWSVVFSKRAVELAERVADTSPSLSLWQDLRNSSPRSDVERAYKCIVLNRTSFSGILHHRAGPIGGLDQKGQYKIDCRFNADRLSDRITTLSKFSDRVVVLRAQDWRATLHFVRKGWSTSKTRESLLWYLDPPFFEKAERLYDYSFGAADHNRLRGQIDKLPGRFILSYDDVAASRQRYLKHPGFLRINLSYNARIDRTERLFAGEILVSDMIARLRKRSVLPPMGRLFVFPERGLASRLRVELGSTSVAGKMKSGIMK